VRLGSVAWPELCGTSARVLLLPLGATEQHGPHLPIATDTIIAGALADAVGAQRSDVVVAPVLPYGSSGEHAGFPGTLSLGPVALESAVVELVRSAERFDGVVVFSWHGGNDEALARAVERLRDEGRRVAVWESTPIEDGDLHAGRIETSLLLALAPELVGDARPAEAAEPLDVLLPTLRAHGVAAVSRSGVLGDATGATADEGAALFDMLVARLSGFVEETMTALRA
jgi:mycofactocin precursor peptide peptidase